MANQPQHSNSDPMAIIVIPLGIIILLVMWWISNKFGLYYAAGKMAYWMLWPFHFIPAINDYRQSIVANMHQMPDPWLTLTWLSAAWRAPALLLAMLALRAGINVHRHPTAKMKGAITVDALMRFQAQVHSPIAPIVAIAKDMHKNLDERFHEPYHPHEAVAKFKLCNSDQTLNREATEKYFIAQLGTRIYRPGLDSTDFIFADRLNNYEKAIFALLAPLAVKIKEGLPDYDKLNDAINYSAVNATQTPDLRLANKLYAEYRAHPKLNNLFRMHHFSTTYLMQLYMLAKRAGKISTSHWVGWLRPNANGLYAALNCAGRQTPFTEASGAFAHWKFELACQKAKRMPILPCVVGAVTGLDEEWNFWKNADQRETEETLWGRMTSDQNQQDQDLFRRYVTDMLSPQASLPAAGADTLFDEKEASERRSRQDEDLANMMSGVKKNLKEEA